MRSLVLVAALSLVLVGCVRSNTGPFDPSKGIYGTSGGNIIATGGGNLQASSGRAPVPGAPDGPVGPADSATPEAEATEATAATEASDF